MRKDLPVRFLAVCVSFLMVVFMTAASLWAQQAGSPPAAPAQLKVMVLEGEGAINLIKMRVTRTPVVQVVDENNKPVAGAMVMFTLPDTGAGAKFADGSKTQIAYTDSAGRAVAAGMKANAIVGNFKITVNASFKGMAASGTLSQTNVVAAAAAAGTGAAAGKTAGAAGAATGISKTLVIVLVAVGGAAAAGAAAAAGKGGDSGGSSTPPPGTTALSVTINPPGTPKFDQPKH